ncbi:MAG: AraC family transcriptional regulator [Planctomycetes bacterium]|nr:AraC family transcriptional regulator [Planctomycetota bacterium]
MPKPPILLPRDSIHRKVLHPRLPDLPELQDVGFDIFTKVGRLGRHEHRGRFEFCLIVRGHVTWWAQDRIYELRGGDVYFTWPDEPHGGLHELMHPCTIYWMTLRVPRPGTRGSESLLHLPKRESKALCAAVHGLQDRHLRGAQELEPYYETLFKHLASERPAPLDIIQARAALQGLLAALVRLPAADAPPGFVPPGIGRAQVFLDDCPRPWPKVKELAELSGMSASHFHACFLRATGMAPMEYAHHKRLERARKLLQARSATVTSVAAQLGYNSSQHLAACFRRYLGKRPSESMR